MLPASNRGVGANMGFPDICPTQVGPATVPVPYPNMAMHTMATPFSPNVKISMMPALNMMSKIPVTTLDEPALPGTNKKMGQFTMGNPIVSINGMPGINLACPTTGNAMQNALGAVTVPSAVNVFFCQASRPAAGSPGDDAGSASASSRATSRRARTRASRGSRRGACTVS
jgi:carboxyl-terminal processing protease